MNQQTEHDWATADAAARALDRVCDRFEAAWKAVPPGDPPRLEDFLPAQAPENRVYFRELLAVELHHRRRAGLPTDRAAYLARFGPFADLIEQEFAAAGFADRDAEPVLGRAFLGDRLPSDPGEETTAPGATGKRHVTPIRIPGYEIGPLLGRGGMGAVYLARQAGFARTVALKVILAGGEAREEDRARFATEAAAAGRLNHPGIVQVYDAGVGETDSGVAVPYLAMEYCPGGSLAEKLAGTPLPPTEAAALLEQVAQAVHAAHQANVLHRDLKPQNVLLDAADLPKVADFGLAKLLGSDGPTHSWAVLGTPAYMAPEQARGEVATCAADVYALGAILYSCLTGRPPFQAPTALEVLGLLDKEEPVSVRQLQPGVPRDLETICHKCLRKEPGQRYASAQEVAEDLRRFQEGKPILGRPVGRLERAWLWTRRHPSQAALGAVSAVAAVLLAVGFWVSARLDAEQARREAADLRAQAALAQVQAEKQLGLASRARARIARGNLGWTWAALDELSQAARLPASVALRAELRSDAAECLMALDVRPAEVAPDALKVAGVPWSLAWLDDGKTLAIGQRADKVLPWWGTFTITLARPGEPTARRDLYAPCNIAYGGLGLTQDGPVVLAHSPQKQLLVAGARSGWVHCWDLSKPEKPPLWSRAGHDTTVDGLAFANDHQSVFTSGGKIVRRWDARTGNPLAEFQADQPVHQLAVHPTEGWLAVGGPVIHQLNERTLRPFAPEIQEAFRCARFTPDGTGLLGMTWGRVAVVDVAFRSLVRHLPAVEQLGYGELKSLDCSPDGALWLTAAGDHHARLWDAVRGRLVAEVHFDASRGQAAFSPDGRTFAVTEEQGVRLYEIGGQDTRTYAGVQAGAVTESFCLGLGSAGLTTGARPLPDDSWLDLRHWAGEKDQPTLRRNSVFVSSGWSLVCLARSPTGLLAWATEPGELHHGCEEPGNFPHTRRDPVTSLNDLTHDPEGRLWMAGGDLVTLWDAHGRRLGELTQSPVLPAAIVNGKPGVYRLAAGPTRAVAGCRDGSLLVLQPTANGPARLGQVQLTGTSIRGVALAADEALAVAGSFSGELIVVALPEGEKLSARKFHDDAVVAVRAAGNGLWASGDRRGEVILWRLRAGEIVPWCTLRHTRPVRDLRFHADEVKLHVLLEGEYGVHVHHLDRLAERFAALRLADQGGTPRPRLLPPQPQVKHRDVEPPAAPHGLRLEVRPVGSSQPGRVSYGHVPDHAYHGLSGTFTARWSGWLRAPQAGLYTLVTRGEGGVRVWIDKALRAESRDAVSRVQVELEAGAHEVVVEQWVGNSPGPWIRLTWVPPGETAEQTIPAPYLFHRYDDAKTAQVPAWGVRVVPLDGVPRLPAATRTTFSKDGRKLAVAQHSDGHGWATILDADALQVTRTMPKVVGGGVVISDDLRYLLLVKWQKALRLVNVATGKLLLAHEMPEDTRRGGIAPDSKRFYGFANELYVWEIGKESPVWRTADSAVIRAAAWSDDGRFLVVSRQLANQEESIEVRNSETGELIRKLGPLPAKRLARTLHLSADGERLVTLGPGGWVSILQVRTGKVVRTWQLPPQVNTIDWDLSPDGKVLVTVGKDGAQVWNEFGRLLAEFAGGHPTSAKVTISPDGRTIATANAGEDGLRLWRLSIPDAFLAKAPEKN